MIRGLIFDFDGLVLDTEITMFQAWSELYLAALDGLGLSADEAIAFEDSPNGVRAARAAGIFCVAVPNPVTARLDLTHADLRLDSLAEPPLAEPPLADLLARIEPARGGGVSLADHGA